MLLVRQTTTNNTEAQKGVIEMREFAIYLTMNAEMENLRREVALRRELPETPSLGDRVISVLRAFRSAVAADAAPTITPTLTDYPYRS
jgi:hypothetical protein